MDAEWLKGSAPVGDVAGCVIELMSFLGVLKMIKGSAPVGGLMVV